MTTLAGSTQGNLAGQTGKGGQDGFVSRYDAAGNALWTRLIGSSASDSANAVSASPVGVMSWPLCARITAMPAMADLGARLRGFSLEHPEAEAIAALLQELGTDREPIVSHGPELRYRAQIETPAGLRELS